MDFVRNAWYVASLSKDIGRELTHRTILEEPVVLYRTEAGAPVAMEDRCPHRFLPLSMGKLKGDAIECGYHGLTFDCTGQCIRVPGQDNIPSSAKVRSYPVRDNMGLLWIWMGDPALADATPVYDLPQYHDPAWAAAHGDALAVSSGYLGLADNLCDPAHVSFVHASTLGSASGEDIPVTCERDGNTVITSRWTLDSDPVPFFQVFGDFKGHVDRWQYYYLHAPSTAIIDFGSADAGAGAPDGNRDECIQVFSCHFLTPVTAGTCIDYWLHVRNFAVDDASVGEKISDQFRVAFQEDKVIMEAVQAEEDRLPDRRPIRIAVDVGTNRLRQVIKGMLDAEQDRPNEAAAD